MVSQALNILVYAFRACVAWTDTLFQSVQGKGVLLAALLIVFVTSLFIMPLRGGSVNLSNAITDYAGSTIYKGKYSSGKKTVGSRRMHGKFEKGNKSAQLVRKRQHNS